MWQKWIDVYKLYENLYLNCEWKISLCTKNSWNNFHTGPWKTKNRQSIFNSPISSRVQVSFDFHSVRTLNSRLVLGKAQLNKVRGNNKYNIIRQKKGKRWQRFCFAGQPFFNFVPFLTLGRRDRQHVAVVSSHSFTQHLLKDEEEGNKVNQFVVY